MFGLQRYIKALLDLFFPRKCIVCGKKLNVSEEHLCLYCFSDLPLTRFWTLSHNPMSDAFNAVLQKEIRDGGPREHYAYAAALFFYDPEADYRRIPYQIKYHGNTSAGKYFGSMLGKKLSEAEWLSDVDMVIPVPLHWKRRWSRGYNQAEIIAEALAGEMGVPIRTDVLKRVRYTQTQTKLEVEAKSQNVSGAFRAVVLPQNVRHILIVDDVFTTGSTVGECFQALRAVLPSSVRISVATLGFVGEV